MVSLGLALVQVRLHFFPVNRFGILQFLPCFLPGVIAFLLPHVPRAKSLFWLPFLLLLVAAYVLFPNVKTAWMLCLILGFAIPRLEKYNGLAALDQ